MLVTFKGKDIFECAKQAEQFVRQIKEPVASILEDTVVEQPEDEDMAFGEPMTAEQVFGLGPQMTRTEVTTRMEEARPADLTGELDKAGMPWDPRIHSATKAVTVKGLWRYRRGIEDADIERIEAATRAEIRPAMESSVDVQKAVAPVIDVPVITPVAPAPVAPVIPFPSAPPTPPPVDTNVSLVHSLETFKTNMVSICAKLVMDKRLAPEYVEGLKSHFKVQQLWDLTDDQKGQMFDSFVQHGLVTRA